MKDLIAALLIFARCLKKEDVYAPISCEHDVMYVCGVDMNKLSLDDVHKLYELGFIPGDGDCDYELCEDVDFKTIIQKEWDSIKNELTDCFYSYRFGSC